MRKLVEDVAGRYDRIILDTLLGVMDPEMCL